MDRMPRRTRNPMHGIAAFIIIAAFTVCLAGFILAGCETTQTSDGDVTTFNLPEGIKSWASAFKGELIGNDYDIWEYDNFGNKVLTVHGDKVGIEGDKDTSGAMSSYIDITVDGRKWEHVGNTLVFCQKGVDMITDFELPEDIEAESQQSTGLMPADRIINNFKNFMGAEKTIVVFSQTGAPVCMFQGKSVSVTVPSNMPKMTRVSVDGKQIYVHRANVDILPTDLIQSTT